MPSLVRGNGQAGQAIVLMTGAIILAVALLGVIIDGGNVFAQQRITQNGADASAESGAVVLAQRLAGVTMPVGGWDAAIDSKIQEFAAANSMTIKAAYYTDICGIPLKDDGTAALNGAVEDLAAALEVGNPGGALPGGAATTPDCPNLAVGPVAGVIVVAQKNVSSFVARAINIASFDVTTRATAVTGYLQGVCDASQGNACSLLPVTIPVDAITCGGTNGHTAVDTGQAWTFGVVYRVPLCSTDPGNVGWLDWTPPNGGASELVCSIVNPNNPAIDLPSWQFVTQTGNTNGGGGPCGASVEGAIRAYDGQVVFIPQFDLTCAPMNSDPDPDSTKPAINTSPNYGCPEPPGAAGQKLWYRMPSFAYFELCDPANVDCQIGPNGSGLMGAYIGGNNRAECDTGSGATSCLVGKFVDVLASGTVGAGFGSGTGSKTLGVQLIK